MVRRDGGCHWAGAWGSGSRPDVSLPGVGSGRDGAWCTQVGGLAPALAPGLERITAFCPKPPPPSCPHTETWSGPDSHHQAQAWHPPWLLSWRPGIAPTPLLQLPVLLPLAHPKMQPRLVAASSEPSRLPSISRLGQTPRWAQGQLLPPTTVLCPRCLLGFWPLTSPPCRGGEAPPPPGRLSRFGAPWLLQPLAAPNHGSIPALYVRAGTPSWATILTLSYRRGRVKQWAGAGEVRLGRGPSPCSCAPGLTSWGTTL